MVTVFIALETFQQAIFGKIAVKILFYCHTALDAVSLLISGDTASNAV